MNSSSNNPFGFGLTWTRCAKVRHNSQIDVYNRLDLQPSAEGISPESCKLLTNDVMCRCIALIFLLFMTLSGHLLRVYINFWKHFYVKYHMGVYLFISYFLNSSRWPMSLPVIGSGEGYLNGDSFVVWLWDLMKWYHETRCLCTFVVYRYK